MKTTEEIKKQLETLKPLLKKKYQVETLGIFGSYSRGEQTKKSDIDILVIFSKEAHIGFFKFLELEEFLTRKLGVKVDLVTKNALKPGMKDQILKETVYA
ncbi:MAG: nucleotidyltransferase family protein [Candidatus Bathyarchaeota archaeon]|nr:nucleotidyltransferase family protein [Candidatus Bathyarchaeota archaeon]